MNEDSDEPPETDSRRLRDLIENSSDLIGAVAGGAIGLVGGPAGSIGGAAAGVAITKTIRRVGVEVYDRLLVSRQQERVGTVLAVALDDAQTRAKDGEKLRDDGFFDSGVGQRSDADELLEGVLLQAANAYQERKLRHLGAILPSLAVRPDISPADGHWLTQLADRLTWRQFAVLAIFADPHSASGIWGVPMVRWRLTVQGRLLVDVARLDDISTTVRESVLDDLLA
jgi:hypothetical protein